MNRAVVAVVWIAIGLSQLSYYFNHLSNELDDANGVVLLEPIGYENPYYFYSVVIRAFTEVLLSVFVAYTCIKQKLNGWALMSAVFFFFSTSNRFVDLFFDPYTFGLNEAVFLGVAIITSIWARVLWKIHQ